jgi:putative SOS response-associated peptidase YedK
MCGRFTLTATPEALNQLFPLFDNIDLEPQYNIAPSQNVLAVRVQPGGEQLEAVRLRWGLVPSWADDPKVGYRLINARVETARDKPAFRAAFKQRHCLVLADGFYEWQATKTKQKQPYHLRLRDGRPFAFAGLWENWQGNGQTLQSCTILTTDANAAVRPVHNRMPVILDPARYRHWLSATGGAEDYDYLGPYPAEEMMAVAVSTHVNSPKNNDPACLTPKEPPATLF